MHFLKFVMRPTRKTIQTLSWLLLTAAVLLCALFALGAIGGRRSKNVHNRAFNIGYSSYVYSGDIQGGRFNGKGEIVFSDGSSYIGGFADGRFHGRGVFSSIDGWRYEGFFSGGKMTGEGAFTGLDGVSG